MRLSLKQIFTDLKEKDIFILCDSVFLTRQLELYQLQTVVMVMKEAKKVAEGIEQYVDAIK